MSSTWHTKIIDKRNIIMKKLLCVITTIIFLLTLTVLCFAHSGRTDANGGHFDHSTGEYHYHNGNSNHGIIEKNDDTDRSYFYDNTQYTKEKTTHSYEEDNNTNGSYEEKKSSFDIFDFFIILIHLAFAFFGSGVIISILSETTSLFDEKKYKSAKVYKFVLVVVFLLLFIVLFYIAQHLELFT